MEQTISERLQDDARSKAKQLIGVINSLIDNKSEQNAEVFISENNIEEDREDAKNLYKESFVEFIKINMQ